MVRSLGGGGVTLGNLIPTIRVVANNQSMGSSNQHHSWPDCRFSAGYWLVTIIGAPPPPPPPVSYNWIYYNDPRQYSHLVTYPTATPFKNRPLSNILGAMHKHINFILQRQNGYIIMLGYQILTEALVRAPPSIVTTPLNVSACFLLTRSESPV